MNHHPSSAPPPPVAEALRALGIENLLLGIHDPAFPSARAEDLGRGSPYSHAASEFLRFIRALGFDGLQLGPQGLTSPINQSPYDGSLFSRNPMSVAFLPLTRAEWGRLLRPEALEEAVAGRLGPADRVPYRYAYHATETLLAEVVQAFRRQRGSEDPALRRIRRGFEAFLRSEGAWVERDGLYEALRWAHGGRDWREWRGARGRPADERLLWAPPPGREAEFSARRTALAQRYRGSVEAYALVQFLLWRQHRRFRRLVRRLGLKLLGDLQIGISERDAWYAQAFLLRGYVMGAPPSRTNPEGQPWGYPVLDPHQYVQAGGAGGPAVRFVRERLARLFSEFDGVRVDHPHGLICPWVYRAGSPRPFEAVQAGARLFASPDLPDHRELAAYAVARPDQLDRSVPRYADGWVRELTPEQVERYGILLAEIMEMAEERGGGARQIACEILSTQPYPVRRVMERYGLGRFRVTQKADLDRPDDVYRAENARPEDWVMLGNHDTKPIWRVAEEWTPAEALKQAEYLAWRLFPAEERERWVRRAASDDRSELVQAKFADLFVGPARNVMVFFTDLFGYRESYNRPGTVDDENWSLRVRPGYEADYSLRLEAGRVLDLPKALARALRARGAAAAGEHRELLRALATLASRGQRPPDTGEDRQVSP
ncbi:MAG: 4-alpha-glucanotransferase [Deltaproteobacteria bacterium]|nr:4-alpha-glucanotransferase [Deltaproteobacteria bacterium]